MIVEDQLESPRCWIGRIEEIQEFDELVHTVALFDECVGFASHK